MVLRVARTIADLAQSESMTTSHEYRGYVFTIAYEPKDPAYSVDFPEVPEIITSGDSLAQAFANACEALDLHLESLQKLNFPAPRARHHLVLQETGDQNLVAPPFPSHGNR